LKMWSWLSHLLDQLFKAVFNYCNLFIHIQCVYTVYIDGRVVIGNGNDQRSGCERNQCGNQGDFPFFLKFTRVCKEPRMDVYFGTDDNLCEFIVCLYQFPGKDEDKLYHIVYPDQIKPPRKKSSDDIYRDDPDDVSP